uniref:Uncharacterized protein n=1 Tax=Anguilla anguilla TaxID=7936 RepID=A0A0E9RIF3_ANGAN
MFLIQNLTLRFCYFLFTAYKTKLPHLKNLADLEVCSQQVQSSLQPGLECLESQKHFNKLHKICT